MTSPACSAVGADKIGVNSAAIARPALIDEIADRFGAQVLVLSLDVKRAAAGPSDASPPASSSPPTAAAPRPRSTRWTRAREAIERGAGELWVSSIDADGTREGFDLDSTHSCARSRAFR